MTSQPDNKEISLEEFLKSLRIAFNYILLYSNEHNSFVKSVGELRQALNTLFAFMEPVTIGFTPDALVIDGKTYNKLALHKELAKMFHARKVKSIQLRKGVSIAELLLLLERLSMPTKEILEKGGVSRMINPAVAKNMTVEDLDYSRLLTPEGEDISEVWSFMFTDGAGKENHDKIKEFADNFDAIIAKFKASDLIENNELNINLGKFLAYIRTKDEDKFRKCSMTLLQMLLKTKGLLVPENLHKISGFFVDLDERDIADTIGEAMASEEGADPQAFAFFSSLFGKEKGDRVALSFSDNVKSGRAAGLNAKVSKKVKELFIFGENSLVPEVYRHAIASLVEGDVSAHKDFSFDRRLIQENYRFILLNLLADEDDGYKAGFILEKLFSQWDKIISERSPGYLKSIAEFLERKKGADGQVPAAIAQLAKRFTDFLEDMAWEENITPGLQPFLDRLSRSSAGEEFYLRRIFGENKVNPRVLKLFFKFFPGAAEEFKLRLENKSGDIEFLARIIEAFKELDSPISLVCLRHIFSFGNDQVKIEVLKAMAAITDYDEALLIGTLKQGPGLLKKEAMAVLLRTEELKEKGAGLLFAASNPWGRENNALLESMDIADELDLRPAAKYLAVWGKKPFFWHAPVRNRARQILEKWKC
ncbi:MAG: hypothetical protein PHH68_04175 [Candidatus Omnitrophica bacterium]|jgi:hypothetical protein|nr:hypothetical protein [Candidatus Omnitrophota bacterium]MDD5079506.1 hypothetical protein [Candidatus Omnitrophota bacterium]